ncbi:hypothetical protein FTW19_08330 [Terriglobus albidus]|uniref:IPT/TIG domain-containing protein n=1 Tax=Terriglobus albidus TaxID=1592106 RepID=A0A5B9EC09_9BACT|nr:IPT/TIG domain-containing protein [Terriglobus albidus]QEE28001.1 hypothetical protein FTW19_08330 [Terriglobus albidus]
MTTIRPILAWLLHRTCGSRRSLPFFWVLAFVISLDTAALAANPNISSISPNAAAVGATINISGSNFGASQGTSTLKINGTAVTSISSWTASSIVGIVPSGASSGNVVVTVSGRTSNSVAFTLLPTPTISSISPTSGPTGSSVTITGSGFGASQGNGNVIFYQSGQYASITSWSNTSIVAIVPSDAVTGNVVVQTSGVNSNGALFTAWPRITSVSPGVAATGSSVTITGANFGSSQGSSTVAFNGVSASVTSWSATSIATSVPSGATTGNVVVTVGGNPSNNFYFVVGVLSTAPYHLHQETGGVSGTLLLSTAGPDTASTFFQSVDLKGSSGGYTFINTFTTAAVVPGYIPASTSLTFNLWMNETASVSGLEPYVALSYINGSGSLTGLCYQNGTTYLTTTLTKYTFTCSIPSAMTLDQTDKLYAQIGVWNAAAGTITKSVKIQLYIEGTPNLNYDSAITIPEVLYPYISNVSPSSGAAATSVTITGGQFGSTQGSSTVTFNGVAGTPSNWTDSSITVPVPANASTGPIVITVAGQSTTWSSFTVLPAITGISPSSGPVGTSVTVSGSGFGASQGSSSISFNGIPAAPTSWSGNTIVAPVPVGASTGPVTVTISGVVVSGGTFTVTPLIIGVAPTAGAVGSAVRIQGYNFGTTQGTVTFNGVQATLGNWVNTSIVATVPAGAVTGPVVVTAGGIASNSFSFSVAPSIASLSPTSGGTGTTVTISGANFGAQQGGSRMLFNGIVATPSSWSDTSIVAPVPSSASTGPVTVVVNGSSSNGIVFTTGPTIASLTPNSGVAGTSVTILGSNFGALQSSGYVTFGGMTASPTSWSVSKIVVPVPAGTVSGQVVVAANGLLSNGVAFTIGSGSLAGTVTKTSDGSPISGCNIQVLKAGTVAGNATTAADGTYSIANLAAGTYDVIASATGYGTSRTPNIAVTVNSAATANFALATPGTVSGHVTKTDGVTGISGATVSMSQGGEVMGTATSDSSGNYSIASLSAGTYTATAASPGYTSATISGLSVSTGATSANFTLQGQSVISYAYDASGRLISVSDSQSDTATYQYDAVGNLLSIGRQSSSQTAIIQLAPSSGPVGTAVTITGTGFSATPSQNSVAFNGTSATVTSASATQLIVSVPTGATTGTVSLTAPGGSATSSGPFTVTSGTGAPTITSFTPTSGVPGTSITITGTGFDPTPINDVVKISLSAASVSAATATSLTVSLPGSTASGHISVGTKSGMATSTQDFYVPFGTHAATDIGFTGRMTTNSTQTVSIGTAGKIGLMLFDGVAGQNVSINVGSSSFGYCSLLLIDPFGNQLATTGCGSGGYLPTQTLTYSGTYTVGIDPGGTTGAAPITLNGFSTVTGVLQFAAPTLISTSYPGQKANFVFSGVAGQILDLALTDKTYSTCFSYTIVNPNGSTLKNGPICGSGAATGVFTLPGSGTYSLLIDPGSSVGAVTATLTQRINQSLALNTPLSISSTLAGQLFNIAFSGSANQIVDLALTSSAYNPCLNYTLLNPDGSALKSSLVCGSGASTGALTLPSSGTYSLLIDPGPGVGGLTMTLTQRINQSLTLNTPLPISSTLAGQIFNITFSGSTNQIIDLALASDTYGSCLNYTLLNPDSSTLKSSLVCGGGATTGVLTLPSSGTYSILIDPGAGVGGLTAILTQQISQSLTFNTPASVSSTLAGQVFNLTFSGSANQVVNVSMTNASYYPCWNYAVLKPDGSTLNSGFSCASSANTGNLTLPTTGTYSVLIDPALGTGGVTVTASLIQ